MATFQIDPVGPPPPLDNIMSADATSWFRRLHDQMYRDTDPTPRIVARETINGTTVQVVNATAWSGDPDERVRRDFLWVALAGDITVEPPAGNGANWCRITGGTEVATSILSAGDALTQAHRAVTGGIPA